MDIYAQNILDHYRNPRNFGSIKKPSVSFRVTNPLCGDSIEFDLLIAKGRIHGAKFRGEGCAISQASASLLSEHIQEKKLRDILRLTFSDVQKFLGVPITERRKKCALLGLLAVQNSLEQYLHAPKKSWEDILELNVNS